MTERKLTIEQAIDMRDKLKRKISRKTILSNSFYSTTVDNYSKNQDKFDKLGAEVKAAYQSATTMALNYDILSSAIMQSNHSTTLPGIKGSNGKDITVAEAISIMNSPTAWIVGTIRKAKETAYKCNTAFDGIIVSPIGEDVDTYIDKYDAFTDRLRTAIKESNRNKIITINLVD
jgi:hypothetical protein